MASVWAARMTLVLLGLSCRQGRPAGTGAACGATLDCRIGYVCVAGSCERGDLEDASSLRDGTVKDRPREIGANEKVSEADVGVIATDAVLVPDGPSGTGGPTLKSCQEHQILPTSTGCSDVRPGGGYAFAIGANSVAAEVSRSPTTIVRLWSLKGGVPTFERDFSLFRIPVGTLGSPYVMDLAFSFDEMFLATAGEAIVVWRVATGREEFSLVGEDGSVPSTVVGISANGESFASYSPFKVWSLSRRTGRELLPPRYAPAFNRAISPESPFWAAFVSNDPSSYGWVMLMDLNAVNPKPIPITHIGTGSVITLALSSDLRTLAVASRTTGGIHLWDVTEKSKPRQNPTSLRPPERELYLVSKLDFSPDGRYLLTTVVPLEAGPAPSGDLALYEVATGRLLSTKFVMGRHPRAGFTSDGSTVAIYLPECTKMILCKD